MLIVQQPEARERRIPSPPRSSIRREPGKHCPQKGFGDRAAVPCRNKHIVLVLQGSGSGFRQIGGQHLRVQHLAKRPGPLPGGYNPKPVTLPSHGTADTTPKPTTTKTQTNPQPPKKTTNKKSNQTKSKSGLY